MLQLRPCGALASFGTGCPDGAKRRGYSAWGLRNGFYEEGVEPFHSPSFPVPFFGFFFLPFLTLFSFLCGECCEELGVALGVGVGVPLTSG